MLCARVEPARRLTLGAELARHQPYRGLRIVDERRLRCAYDDGVEPYVLHHYLEKPWVKPMYHGIYSRLLSRLWLGEDVAIPIAEADVPARMRRGARAMIRRTAVNAIDLARWYARDVIPDRWRARRGAGKAGRE